MRWKFKSKAQKWDVKVERQCRWHKWFAWRPVQIEEPDGTLYRVWLSTVGRKKELGSYSTNEGMKHYLGNTNYCDLYDIIPKSLIEDETVNTNNASLRSQFQIQTMPPPKHMPKTIVTKV